MESSDDGNGSDSAGDSGPFTPKQLSGLALWLDDDVGAIKDPQHSTAINKWFDQSGNSNDAVAVNATQTWFEIDPSAVNGHDAFKCMGNGTFLDTGDAASLQWGTGDFAIAMVAKWDSQAFPLFYFKDTGSQSTLLQLFDTNGNLELYTGGTLVVGAPASTKFHVVITKRSPLQMSIDGLVSSGPASTANVSNMGGTVHICQQGGTNVEIAEVIAVKGTLSVTDQAKLETYLKTKFKL